MGAPQKLVDLLRATSMMAAMESLVRVKSYFPKVDMAKVGEGLDSLKNLKAMKMEVQPIAENIVDTVDYEGDDDDE
jgi:hypothetical protein